MSQYNARLIETDVLADVTPTEAGSGVVDLNGASKFSCQAIYDVQAPSAKTFDSPQFAALVNQSLTYTSVVAEEAANDITIEYVDTGVPSQALEVNVTADAISVNLALDAGTASTLVVQDLTYTAQVAGEAGDDITIQYVGDGTSGAETVDVTGTAIVVHMDPTAVTGSSADDILAAIEADGPADALVAVAVTGTGVTVQAVAAATPLAGGVDPAITSTGNAVKTAVNADSPGAADLVLVTGANASPVTAFGPTNLAGGSDGEVNLADSEFTIPSHGFTTGFKVQLTTTGTLPAPLLTATDYFVIVVDANTIQLAETLADALAGTEIELSDVGSDDAVNTVTGVALAGASVTFQKSNDGSNWADIQAATSISADGSVLLVQPDVSYRYFKAVKALTSGQVDLKALVLVIGDAI